MKSQLTVAIAFKACSFETPAAIASIKFAFKHVCVVIAYIVSNNFVQFTDLIDFFFVFARFQIYMN